jgi:predicted nuclease with TOPRIM domain
MHDAKSETYVKRKQLDDHLKECPEELVDCPFTEAGCTERIRRCQLENHMASQVQKHFTVLMGAYKEVKRRLEELENKPEPLKAKRPRFRLD